MNPVGPIIVRRPRRDSPPPSTAQKQEFRCENRSSRVCNPRSALLRINCSRAGPTERRLHPGRQLGMGRHRACREVRFPRRASTGSPSQGIRFTNFNVQNQCTPTRSALHTGRLPIRSGTQRVPAPGEPDGLAPWEYTIAELLLRRRLRNCSCMASGTLATKEGPTAQRPGLRRMVGNQRKRSNGGEPTRARRSSIRTCFAEIPLRLAGSEGQEVPRRSEVVRQGRPRASLDREIHENAQITFHSARAPKDEKAVLRLRRRSPSFHPPWGVHPDFKGTSPRRASIADIEDGGGLQRRPNRGCHRCGGAR